MSGSFHFDENSEMLDSNITHIRQVTLLLGYGEPHVLEVFKNTLASRLYWVLFPIEDLRQVVKLYDRLKEEDRQVIELNFSHTPDILKEYLDMYDGVKSEVLSTTKFDENSDLSTMYLDRINMTRLDKIKVEERFPISEQGYTVGKLLAGMECQILLDKGVS